MVDIGLLNYIKNQIASGKTKEEIASTLIKSGNWQQDQINEAFLEAESGNTPSLQEVKTFSTPDTIKNRKNIIILIFVIIAIAIVGFLIFKNPFSSKPSVAEITPVLKAFLEKSRNDCDEVNIKKLSNISFGDYVNQEKADIVGYPIYADSEVECVKVDNSRSYPMRGTYNYATKAVSKTPVAYTKKLNGRWVVYIPNFFKVAGTALQNELKKMGF